MIKNNKWTLVLASIVILLPAILGIVFEDSLPESVAIHWNFSGEADGFAFPAVAFLTVSLVLLAVFWLLVLVSNFGFKDQNKKIVRITLWIIPVISCAVNGIIWLSAFGVKVKFEMLISILLGIMFMVIGNYMPKAKQNAVFGIKIKNTLQNEENWNATHRFAGKLYFIGGIVMLLIGFLPESVALYVMLALAILIGAVLPSAYSYAYRKKQLREGRASVNEQYSKYYSKKYVVISAIAGVVIFIVVAFLMFSGDIELEFADDYFVIKADLYQDITVKYEDIDSIEYRENFEIGNRVYGYASARLLMGKFKNSEFGNYEIYSYTRQDEHILLENDGKYLAISGENAEITRQYYEKIAEYVK